MCSKIKNIKYSVTLNSAIFVGISVKESITYQRYSAKAVPCYQEYDKIVCINTENRPQVEENSKRYVHAVLKKYEQVNCLVDGSVSSVLLEEGTDDYLLYSTLLEQIERKNAKNHFYNTEFGRTTLYLTYGYQFEKDGIIRQYDGFLNSFERDLLCYQKTGVMHGENISELETKIIGIENVLPLQDKKKVMTK